MPSKRRTCTNCGVEKSPSCFYSNTSPICKICKRGNHNAINNRRKREKMEKTRQANVKRLEHFLRKNNALTLPAEPIAVTPEDKEAASRIISRRRLLPFVLRFQANYLPGWVHEDICRRLERFVRDVELGKSPRLLICMPPRAGKSTLTSRFFPAWLLGQHPEWEVIAASHTQSLALKFSGFIRDLLRDPSYQAVFPECKLDPESQSKEAWDTTSGGGYLAAGIGTGITGRGCFSRNTLLQSLTHSEMMPIDTLRVGDYVYGYNHKTRRAEPVRILAVSLSRTTRPLFRVRDIVCTDDHEFCTSFDGRYTPAGRLRPDMSVVRLEEVQNVEDVSAVLQPGAAEAVEREGVPWVRGKEGRPRRCVPEVQGSRAAGCSAGGTSVRTLWEAVRAQAQRARCGTAKVWRAAGVLLTDVLRGAPEASGDRPRNLWGLRGATDTVRAEEVLLARVLFEAPAAQAGGLRRRVRRPEEAASGTERPEVCPVCTEDVPGGCASHRPRRGEQRGEELGAVVLSLSQVVSHLHGVCAGDLEGSVQDTDGTLVVDLQTETGNFFCGAARLLVHNCHVLVIDDPVKDMEAADSVTIRDNTWEWYGSTAYTRLAPGGGVLGILTLWNEDDWGGRIIEVSESGEGDKFEIVRYPAINEGYDEYLAADDTIEKVYPGQEPGVGSVLVREQDSALHPERYSLDMLLKIRKNFYARGNQRTWSALYQQNPTVEEGNFFTKDMMRYYTHEPPRIGRFVAQAWDFAITTKQSSDFTVCSTMLQDERDDLYELDLLHMKSDDSFVIVDAILDQYEAHRPDVIGFEDGQIWKSIKALFEKRCHERRLYPSYEVLTPLSDKMVRAGPLRGRMQQKKIHYREDAPYRRVADREMLTFPAAKHDDIVDARAWCARLMLGRAAPRLPAPKPLKGWRERLRERLAGAGADGSHMGA